MTSRASRDSCLVPVHRVGGKVHQNPRGGYTGKSLSCRNQLERLAVLGAAPRGPSGVLRPASLPAMRRRGAGSRRRRRRLRGSFAGNPLFDWRDYQCPQGVAVVCSIIPVLNSFATGTSRIASARERMSVRGRLTALHLTALPRAANQLTAASDGAKHRKSGRHQHVR